jgi:hypothetical protein
LMEARRRGDGADGSRNGKARMLMRWLWAGLVIHVPSNYELPMLDNMQKIAKVLDLRDLARIRADVEASVKRG